MKPTKTIKFRVVLISLYSISILISTYFLIHTLFLPENPEIIKGNCTGLGCAFGQFGAEISYATLKGWTIILSATSIIILLPFYLISIFKNQLLIRNKYLRYSVWLIFIISLALTIFIFKRTYLHSATLIVN